MNHIPAAHHPQLLVAIRMGRILAAAGLVHPVSDIAAEMDVVDWLIEFTEKHGTYLGPFHMSEAQYDEVLEGFVYLKASTQGWMTREVRDTRGEPPADFYFKQQVAAVQKIQKIPSHLPRSCAHQALIDSVVTELRKRALHALRMGIPQDNGVISFERDGQRFERMLMYGVGIANCGADERNKSAWIAALESSLGINVKSDASHQVLVAIDGEDIACGAESVRVQVFNDRLGPDGADGCSMVYNFTSEGVITDLLHADGNFLGTASHMYDEEAEGLRADDAAEIQETPR